MIRGLTIVRQASAEKLEQFSVLLRALGFEEGASWNDEHSTGASFLAPVGNLELVNGRAPAETDILIEVSDLDTAHRIAREHLPDATGEIAETHWKSRVFSIQLDLNLRAGFWAFSKSAPNETFPS